MTRKSWRYLCACWRNAVLVNQLPQLNGRKLRTRCTDSRMKWMWSWLNTRFQVYWPFNNTRVIFCNFFQFFLSHQCKVVICDADACSLSQFQLALDRRESFGLGLRMNVKPRNARILFIGSPLKWQQPEAAIIYFKRKVRLPFIRHHVRRHRGKFHKLIRNILITKREI